MTTRLPVPLFLLGLLVLTATPSAFSQEGDATSQAAESDNSAADGEAAAQEESAPDATSEPNVEPPSLLGEFVGSIGDEGEVLALQIRPVGGGDFDGLAYRGGLPGAGAQLETATRLIGHRAGQGMVLSGTEYAIFVTPDGCRIVSFEGKLLGTLERAYRTSPTLGAIPPDEAIVLFDGSGTEQFSVANMTEDGLLKQGADMNALIQDFDLHLEFMLPLMAEQDSQSRGNSGIYIHSRYECQILDSFATKPVFNGCGSIYRFKKPDVNMCLAPKVWQTYDIRFTAARWDVDGKKIRNARLSSWLNGVQVQKDVELLDKTGNGKPEGPELLPTRFQNHKDPVRFRNIWMLDRGLATSDSFPPVGESNEAL